MLHGCGCWGRDPLHACNPGVDGYEAAAAHLLSVGLTPAPNIPAMRVMWRHGGDGRRLARTISEFWEAA